MGLDTQHSEVEGGPSVSFETISTAAQNGRGRIEALLQRRTRAREKATRSLTNVRLLLSRALHSTGPESSLSFQSVCVSHVGCWKRGLREFVFTKDQNGIPGNSIFPSG